MEWVIVVCFFAFLASIFYGIYLFGFKDSGKDG